LNQWIGEKTEYLTELPYMTTIDDKPTKKHKPAAIIASTATAAASDIAKGDVSVAPSPKVLDVLRKDCKQR
jgi:hypothetical protein